MHVPTDARPRQASGPGGLPSTSAAAPNALHQEAATQRGRLRGKAITPAHLLPSPTSPLGLASYTGPGPALWFSSCHGGSGITTLITLIPAGMSSGQYWPALDAPGQARVVLVARDHAAGLLAAQAATRQWAAGVLPNVRLLGLAVVADAPGKRPKPLNDLVRLIAGGLPQVWELPWVEALRLGEPPTQIKLPSAYSKLANDLRRTVSEEAHA
ncbi:hypothetical protein GCM10010191_44750 [Actinomadura vinacea]|uniref:Uncharacterized protein n=1 Tax=Actinomadura vinacea TaxID=115336 RepID=A0ABP5WK07_9ACTN